MVDTIKFSEFVNGGDLENDETTVGLDGGVNTRFNNPWTFLKPGTTGDRPTPAVSMYYRLRFNTTLEVYEYYDPTTVTWTQLSGTGTGTVNPGVANDIAFYAASGQSVSPIASLANAVLRSNGSGVPSMSTTLPSGLSIPGAIITASTAALTAGSVVAAPVAGTDLVNKTYADALFGAGVASATGTTNQVLVNGVAGVPTSGAITLSLPQDIAVGSTPTFAGMTLSSIPLGSSSGGTGINNGSNTLTLAGSLATIGAFASNFTMTGATNVTFPTSGTLLTSASAVTSLAATANQTTVSAATGAVTVGLASNPILPGTGGVTLPQGNTAARAGGAGTIRFNTQTSLFEVTVDGVAWVTLDTHTGGDVDSITGTANQIIASSPTGNVTLSLPQDIATTSSPTFAGLTLTNPHIAGAGGLTSFQIFTSGTAATYTRPAGITSILVEVLGGGGGGGGCQAGGVGFVSVAGGGGAGGYARLWVPSASSTYTYTVGSGGNGATAGNNSGSAGGTTTFSASSLQATGGSGGIGGAPVANTGGGIGVGSDGGVGSNGNFNAGGMPGGNGLAIVGIVRSGEGGSSIYGGGARGVTVANGNAAANYGSGGSGASTGATTDRSGGNGSAGLIIVWEFS